MAELFRMAGDPLGLAFDLMVPCPTLLAYEPRLREWVECTDDCTVCHGDGLFPNPVITEPCNDQHCTHHGDAPAFYRDSCDGRGFRVAASVRVPERVRRSLNLVVNPEGRVLYRPDLYTSLDITHLWEQPCPSRGPGDVVFHGCKDCNNRGTVFVPASLGEVWEIGERDCELLPVVAGPLVDGCPPYKCVVVTHGEVLICEPIIGFVLPDGADHFDISHHFATPPEPGQRAGVCAELVLAERAVKR